MTCSLHPNEHKNFQLSLLFQQLKKLVHERTCKCQKNKNPLVTKTLDGLSKAEQVFFEQSLFGCYAGPNKTPAMRRLLESTLELAFPQTGKLLYHNRYDTLFFRLRRADISTSALNQKRAEAKAHGTDIERDSVGLPAYVLMPGEAREPGLWRQRPSVTRAGPPCLPTVKATSSRVYGGGPPPKPLTHIDDTDDACASKGEERLRGFPENSMPLRPNVLAALPKSLFEVMPESSEQQVLNLKFGPSHKARLPRLEYLWNLPVTPGRTAPRAGPIYPKGMDSNVVPSQATSKLLNEAFPNPASLIKPSVTAGEATEPQATKKGSSLSSSDSKAGHAVAKSAQRFNRPPRRKSVQGSSPMVVVKENGSLVTYTSPTRRDR